MSSIPYPDVVPRQVIVPTSIDKNNGKVSVLDGQLFYSPNSSRLVNPPPVDEHRGRQFNIFSCKDARADIYFQPRWWTRTFGWISFIPMNPSYSGALFQRLAYVPPMLTFQRENGDKDYAMPQGTRDQWMRLESHLSYATALIGKEYKIPAVRPFSPWALGYTEGRKRLQVAVAQAHRSRDWFQVWMGLASYMIAHARTAKKTQLQPMWPDLLLRNDFDQNWIDTIRSSTVHDFTGNTLRAGAFVDLVEADEFQPEVAWFCHYQVPVWYRWSPKEAKNSSLALFAPLPHQLQAASTVISRQPLLVPSQAPPPAENSNLPSSTVPPRKFLDFLEARAERNKRRALTETPQDRQTRLNRERQRPVVSAKVYLWEQSDADPNIWNRVPVSRWDREETLASYSASQKVYDSFSNEWDICPEYGEPDEDDHDGDFFLMDPIEEEQFDPSERTVPPYENYSGPRALTPPPRPSQTFDAEPIHIPQIHPIYPGPVAEDETTRSLVSMTKADVLQQEILEILTLHYGYTPPLPLPTSTPASLSEAESKKFIRLLGLSWNHSKDLIYTLPIVALAKSYLDGIVGNVRPRDEQCDFNPHSRLSLATSWRLKHLRVIFSVEEKPRPLYMFDFREKSRVPWKLTMTTVADSLLVCRLDRRLDENEIARYLLTHGIPFQTLLPSELTSRGPREAPPACVLPMRLSDAQFTQGDYDAYVRHRMSIVAQPRGRAALLKGGFVWRLCAPTISFDDVLQGPTGWNPIPGTMFVAQDPTTHETFIDDMLTEIELHLISGTYICQTGIPNQTATRSWYPLPSTLEAGGEYYGRWNAWMEQGFTKRLDEINNPSHNKDSRGPITARKWRDLNRGMKETRRLRDNIERWADAFVKQHIHVV